MNEFLTVLIAQRFRDAVQMSFDFVGTPVVVPGIGGLGDDGSNVTFSYMRTDNSRNFQAPTNHQN